MKKMIKIGTRKSRLALIQTEIVKDKILEAFPHEEVEIVNIVTEGDKKTDRELASFGGKGVFTKEIEDELTDGRIDIAVHSAKDVPMELPEGLEIGAALARGDERDVLVTRKGDDTVYKKDGCIIGTGSLRRELQIKGIIENVQIKQIRGNVPTRIEKLRSGEYDGIILAAAGIKRLGMDKEEDLVYRYFDSDTFIPAAGQGIIALETRKGEMKELLAAIGDRDTEDILKVERTFLKKMDGSCNAPCGVVCKKTLSGYDIKGMYASDGRSPKYSDMKCGDSDVEVMDTLDDMVRDFKYGMVVIAGAGPGDRKFVTEKTMEWVRKADVIIYDNLISQSVLNEAEYDCELIYAGKRAGVHSMKQSDINELIISNASAGKKVVRLKGGDPFIFGRGGEEALACREAGIEYMVIPGVSSAYSVPEMAGIPVTHRGVSSAFHVITGHGRNGDNEDIDYNLLAKEKSTLVFLMGLGHLESITTGLMAGGMDENTPVAVISNGTMVRQKTVTGTVGDIVEVVNKNKVGTPAIIVIGDVVKLRELIGIKNEKIFGGVKVMLTGTKHMTSEMEKRFEKLGAETVTISLIKTKESSNDIYDGYLRTVSDYNWIVFTSAAGVRSFFNRMKFLEVDYRNLGQLKFAVIGKQTGKALQSYGYRYDFAPEIYTSAELAKGLAGMLNGSERVLIVRGNMGSDNVRNALEDAGVSNDTAVLYETETDERRRDELIRNINDVDYIMLGSSSAVKAFAGMTDCNKVTAKIVVIGPETAKMCRKSGINRYIMAERYDISGMIEAVAKDFS